MVIRYGSLFVLLWLSLLFMQSCSRTSKQYSSPPGYDLNRPFIIKLPEELDEISGISYYNKDNSLFAESDAKGCIYKIFLNKPTDIRKWKFSHKRDYEDIVLHDSSFYVLNNNGDIVVVSFVGDSLRTQEFTFPSSGKNEFESLYFDDSSQKLVLVCKDCEVDKKTTTSTYNFDPSQGKYTDNFAMDVDKLSAVSGPDLKKFKPSAAALNPVTGELYILSSINKLLVVCTRNGRVKQAYHLDPQLFVQPEGIAFAPTGNLFLSSEAGNMQPAKIFFYQFKKESK